MIGAPALRRQSPRDQRRIFRARESCLAVRRGFDKPNRNSQ